MDTQKEQVYIKIIDGLSTDLIIQKVANDVLREQLKNERLLNEKYIKKEDSANVYRPFTDVVKPILNNFFRGDKLWNFMK